METILYIVIAIAIMAYQIYNEKNKKEQRGAVNRPPAKKRDPVEELSSDLNAMFDSLSGVNSIEENYQPQLEPQTTDDRDKTSVSSVREKYKPEIPSTETLEAEPYNVTVPINKTDEENIQLLHDIYDSAEISNFDSSEKVDSELDILGKEFDPRLFILYSEIAQPKFKD